MSHTRSDETLNADEATLLAEIDRDLERELSIDPSPDLLARVRVAIGDTPPDSAWSVFSRWGWAAAAIVAIVTLAAVTLSRREDAAPPVIAEHPTTPPATAPKPAPEVTPSKPERPPPKLANATGVRAQIERPSVAAEPEVLVPPGQEQAIRRLLMAMRSGHVDGSSLSIAVGDDALREIVIPPLKIDLLPTPGSETDTQRPENTERPRESPRSAF